MEECIMVLDEGVDESLDDLTACCKVGATSLKV
jgi:hypothetical protein